MTEIQYKNPLTYITAILFSMPVTAIFWVLIIYPVYGVTGVAIHPFIHGLTCTLFYLIVLGWALLGSENSSEVVYRTCRFGAILALLLPVSTGFVSLIWVFEVAERPEAFLAGYSALEIPVYAAAAGMGMIILFLTGSYIAARDMDGVPF